MRDNRRNGVLCGVSSLALAICLSLPVVAQEGNQEIAGQSVEEQDLVDSQNVDTLDTVVITGVRGVGERLLDAPVSVSVRQGEELTTGRLDSVKNLIEFTPNVTYWDQGSMSAPSISIRGVGGVGGAAGVDRPQGVAVFMDDVYIGRSAAYPSVFFDLQGSEIARGPQAVLHGRSATAGIIALHSTTPGDTLSATLSATYGTDALWRGQGAVDIPISEDLRTRTAFFYTRKDGELTNYDGRSIGDIESGGIRFIADYDPSADTQIRFSFDYARERHEGWAFDLVDRVRQHRFTHDIEPIEKRNVGGGALKIKHSFDNFDVTSITAYRGYDYEDEMDGDYSPASMFVQGQWSEQRQFTQELKFSGHYGDNLDWMVGGFYLWESMKGEDWWDLAAMPASTRGGSGVDKKTNSYSIFGTLTYRPTEALEFVGGLRYTYETNDGASYVRPSASGLIGPAQWVPVSPHFSGLNPELTVRYKLSDDAMVYGRVSNGWRAGGIAPFIDAGKANTYEPEKVWSYEVGGKMEWPDQNFSLNVSAFYNDWTDMQALMFKTPSQRVIVNAASARTYGFEIEGAWQATHELQFSFGYGYTNGRYDEFVDPYTGVDYSKNRLPMSPEHSFNAGVNYEREISSGLNFIAGADYGYKSSYYYLNDNLYPSGDIHLVNARIGLSGEHWSATLWSKNLFDERYLSGYFRTGGQDLGAVAEGRSVGLTASWTF